MISDDDLEPKSKKSKARNLENMSVPELKDYAQQLRDEIVRVEADIVKKEKHKSAIDSLFGKS